MKSQESLLASARDKQLAEIQKGLNNAVEEGKISVREAEEQFATQKAAIEKEAYKDSEITQLTAHDRGIQNSAQMLGLMAGDNERKNTMINENVTTRDQRINSITDRLNAIKNNSAIDSQNAHATYGYGLASAQGQIGAQKAQQEFAMGLEDMQARRDQQFTQDNMNMQQGFTQDNMQLQQDFDLTKMSKQQQYTLESMAKSFGYDLKKMSQAQIYNLANMAQSFGYDMSLQNDSQLFQEDQQQQMQDFQVEMFGREQDAKLAEYDLALEREMSSYDKNTPEGKLRLKQLQASKDAMLTEHMTGVFAKALGGTFAEKYGDGMTTQEMKKWLDNPTNLKNLQAKSKKLPEEEKNYLSKFITGVLKGTAPYRIYDAYKQAYKDGLPSFSGAGAQMSATGAWAGKVSSGYGSRKHPVTGKQSHHGGIDIASKNGTAIPANVGGKVIASGNAKKFGYDSSYGNIVVVRDAQGREHIYAHMSKTNARVGSTIKPGANLGAVGSTGRSTGNHLHYTVKVKGKDVNPQSFMPSGRTTAVSNNATSRSFGGYTHAGKQPSIFNSHMSKAVAKGVPKDWVTDLTELIGRESSFNSSVKNKNSSAKGYGQFLSQTIKDYKKKYPHLDYNNPVDQIALVSKYVKDRYGTPAKALKAWQSRSPHWY